MEKIQGQSDQKENKLRFQSPSDFGKSGNSQRTYGEGMAENGRIGKCHQGGFQLEFVSISMVINHMTCYKSSTLIG